MTWQPVSGAAIACRPFVASEKHQVSLLTGDHLEIFHRCDGWLHGRHFHTQIEGIFPECCVAFYETRTIDERALLAKPEDLLMVEARYTMRYALQEIQRSKNPAVICSITNCLNEIVTQVKAFSSTSSREVILNIHHDLATALDELRSVLKLKKPLRTENGSESTLTTWGREMFTQAPVVRLHRREAQHAMFHFSIEAVNLKTKLECRFAIYATKKQPWITEPISRYLSQDNPKCDLLFTDFDKKTLNDKLYLVVYTYEPEDRNIVSVCVCELPACKTDSALRKPTMKFDARSYDCDNSAVFYGIHEKLINREPRVMKSVKDASPTFTIHFTPFFGTKAEFKEKGYTRYQTVAPLFMPNVVPAVFRKSTVTLTANALIQNNPKKKTRLVFRLMDRCQGTFLPFVEDVATGEKNADYWRSSAMKSAKGELMLINESFTIDLLKTKTLMKDLFIAVEVQHSGFGDFSSTSAAYGIIPLASEIGSLVIPSDPRVALYHLNLKKGVEPKFSDFVIQSSEDTGKAVGFLSYNINFSSTVTTTNVTLYKLLNFQQFQSETSEVLQTFSQCGISEWCKFFKKIALNLCLIMVTKPEVKEEAFNQLLFIFSEVLARTTSDYVRQIKEFIMEQFNHEKSTGNHPTLMKLHSVMLPLVLEKIYIDDTSIQFRNMVKCAPYFFEIIMRSLKIRLQSEKVDLTGILSDITRFIERLCCIVREVTSENDIHRKGFVFTNQQFTIQHFAAVISAIVICIPTRQVAPLVVRFITSIRYIPDDRKQPPIEKSKMKCLLALASTSCWKDPESREILAGTYTSILTSASSQPYLLDFVVQILAALFLCVRNDYIVQFIPLLEENYKKEDSPSMARLLLIIAYTVPTKVPRSLMLRLVRSKTLGAPEKLFVFSNFVLMERDELEKMMRDPEQPGMRKLRFLESYLDLSTWATLLPGYDPLERMIQTAIYPVSNIYKTVLALFRAIPKDQRFGLQISFAILRCYMVQNSDDLYVMFRKIVMTDARENGGTPKKIILPLLRSVDKLSKEKGFLSLQRMFPRTDVKLQRFNEQFYNVIRWVYDFRNLEYLSRNQDQLTDAVTKIVKVCEQTTDRDIQPKLLLRLADYHTKCQNYVEAAEAMLRVLDFVPCDYSKRPPYFELKCETGVEVHRAVLKRCIELYAKGNYEDLGLEVVERAKAQVVYPYKFFNFMPDLLKLESSLYSRISSSERTFSKYYFVGFYGTGFDNYYRNRSFIYRKTYNPNESFRDELNLRFPEATIDTRAPVKNVVEGPGMYIQVMPVEIARPQEIENPFYLPEDTHRLKYLVDFELNKGANIFRYEADIGADQATKGMDQCFFYTLESFPSTSFRLEVTLRKTVLRRLNPLDAAALKLGRLNFKFAVETYFFTFLYENEQEIDPMRLSKFTMELGTAVETALNGALAQTIDAFLKHGSEATHDPDGNGSYRRFREALKAHLKAIEDAHVINEKIVSLSMRDMHNMSTRGLEKLKEDLAQYL